MKTHFIVEIRGFNAGETDLRDYCSRAPALETAPELGAVFEAAFEAIYENPNNDKYCALLFVGHADRVPAGSEDQRRSEEETASLQRADFARSWILEMVNGLAQSYGYQEHADWETVERVASFKVGLGAANLATPYGTQAAGVENRRLRIIVSGLNVDVINQRNGAHFEIRG